MVLNRLHLANRKLFFKAGKYDHSQRKVDYLDMFYYFPCILSTSLVYKKVKELIIIVIKLIDSIHITKYVDDHDQMSSFKYNSDSL